MNVMLEKKITVIIPVYNSENFLNRCYYSLKKQTFPSWEAIFINDGSTDRSLDILKELSEKDLRVKVIDKKNGGVSSARNVGLREAHTEYITMLDSDDTLEETALEKMYNAAIDSGCDMVITGLVYYDGTIQRCRIPFPGRLDMTAKLFFRYIHKGPFAKLYKKSIIEYHDIYFPEDMQIAEDRVFIGKYAAHVRDVYNLTECLYQYRFDDNPNSLMHRYGNNELPFKIHIDYAEVPCKIFKYVLNNVKDSKKLAEWSFECYQETWKLYFYTLSRLGDPYERRALKHQIKSKLNDYSKHVSILKRLLTPHRYPKLRYMYAKIRNFIQFHLSRCFNIKFPKS